MRRTLYWVTKDLRINDNLALNLASQSEQLICVAVIDPKWFTVNQQQALPLGKTRLTFLLQGIHELNKNLQKLGQRLHIINADTVSSLNAICRQYAITDLVTTKRPGSYERDITKQLQQHQPQLDIHLVEQFTLFTEQALPFSLSDLPASYSKFRKAVASISPAIPQTATYQLPKQFNQPLDEYHRCWNELFVEKHLSENIKMNAQQRGYYFTGGEQAGFEQLQQYFSSSAPARYKEVRNKLDGWDNSSKLSAWINYGFISVTQVTNYINEFEQLHGKSASTESLYHELLWREYFQWLHYKIQDKLYQFKGLASSNPLTSFYPERFKKWCTANTPFPLVNACINELVETGYLSNRGRQIVASCLVNELSVDWRYGAAWFEQHLIDYDAAINWGNWQYIAGVGVDPRGGRHFNLKKQTQIHDPNGEYQAIWAEQGKQQTQPPLDSVTADDWPVS